MRIRGKYVNVVKATGANVAERWRKSYQKALGGWTHIVSGASEDKYNALIALGPNPDITDVVAVIGNEAWTHINCDGCSEYVDTAIQIGEYDPKSYCRVCITEAAASLP